MKLRINSKTGHERQRAGLIFHASPIVVDVTGLYPTDTPLCHLRGDWPGEGEPTDRAQLLFADDALHVEHVADDTPPVDAEFRPTHGRLPPVAVAEPEPEPEPELAAADASAEGVRAEEAPPAYTAPEHDGALDHAAHVDHAI